MPSPKQRTSLERVRGKDSTEIARSFRIHFLPSFSTVSNSSGKVKQAGRRNNKRAVVQDRSRGHGEIWRQLCCIASVEQRKQSASCIPLDIRVEEAEVWFQACKYLAGMDRKDQHYRLPFNSSRVSDVPIYLSLANVHRVE